MLPYIYLHILYNCFNFILCTFIIFVSVEMFPSVSVRISQPVRAANPETLGFEEEF